MKTSRKIGVSACVAALVAISGITGMAAAAGAPADSGTGTAAGSPAASRHAGARQALDSSSFVTQAAQAGQTEMQAAQIAQDKSGSDDVKSFAQRMITDHTKANMQLMPLAASASVDVPQQLDRRHQEEISRLKAQSGSAFDHAYARQMVLDHRAAVALFKRASTSEALSADLKSFAAQTLPTLEQHLKLARMLETAHKDTAAK